MNCCSFTPATSFSLETTRSTDWMKLGLFQILHEAGHGAVVPGHSLDAQILPRLRDLFQPGFLCGDELFSSSSIRTGNSRLLSRDLITPSFCSSSFLSLLKPLDIADLLVQDDEFGFRLLDLLLELLMLMMK